MHLIDVLKMEEIHKLCKKYCVLTPVLELMNIVKTAKDISKI